MKALEKLTDKIAEVYEKFNEVKIRMDYVEKGTEKNIEGFKAIVEKLDDRLRNMETELNAAKAEFASEIKRLDTLYEAAYKKAITDAISNVGKKEMIKDVLMEMEEQGKLRVGSANGDEVVDN